MVPVQPHFLQRVQTEEEGGGQGTKAIVAQQKLGKVLVLREYLWWHSVQLGGIHGQVLKGRQSVQRVSVDLAEIVVRYSKDSQSRDVETVQRGRGQVIVLQI